MCKIESSAVVKNCVPEKLHDFGRRCDDCPAQVLSVIAQQLLVLREGRLMGKPDINFMGVQIALKDHHVIITMNPGYAGRTELPDNLAVSREFRALAVILYSPSLNGGRRISLSRCHDHVLYFACVEWSKPRSTNVQPRR